MMRIERESSLSARRKYHREYQRKFMGQRKVHGICVHCPNKAMKDRVCCKNCAKRGLLNYRQRHEQRRKQGICYDCPNLARKGRVYCLRHAKICKERTRRREQNLKIKFFNLYGAKCACCGESEFAFLAVDHVNGDGAKERRRLKEIGKPVSIWKHKFGELKFSRYQILCYNCNIGRYRLGVCPHKQKKQKILKVV